ncbi:MAG: aminoglycoside N(3)-acetyltransferase [Bauldia sp.]
MTDAVFTVDRIVHDLEDLGVRRGDLLMVHASLRRIGKVEGGPEGVLDALSIALGATGTMLMVLGARDDWSWVNARDEAERPALLATAEPFDALTTPADPDVGYLAELFRRSPRTLVSNHPEGRFGASGQFAEFMTGNVAWHDYYGAGSPLERLALNGGKVLRLGADEDTVTLLHYSEWLANIPNKRRVRRHRRVARSAGPEIVHIDTIDDSDGIVPWDGEDYFALILRDYLALGRAAQGKVGNARSELIEARDLVAFGVDWMERRLPAGR